MDYQPDEVLDSSARAGASGGAGPRGWRLAANALWFGAAFYALAEVSRVLSSPDTSYVTFWLPGGLYVAGLLLSENRAWPWLVLAVLPANYLFDWLHRAPTFLIGWFYLANTAQAVAGAWLVRRFVAHRPTLSSLRELFGVICCTALVAPAIAATIGALALTSSGLNDSFLTSWRIWWWNAVSSVLVVTPVFLAWLGAPAGSWRLWLGRPGRWVEAGLLVAVIAAFSWYMFILREGVQYPLKFQLLPFMMWTGVRFGKRGATLANLLLAFWLTLLVVHFPKQGEGVADNGLEGLVILQTFLVVSVLVSLVPAAVLEERDRRSTDLQESEERYRNLAAAAFEGIAISENGRIIDVNDQGLKMFGYTLTEMIGEEIVAFVVPEMRAQVVENIRAGRDVVYELSLVRKDGTFFYAAVQAKMVRLGRRALRMTAFQDITTRRQTEISLRDSRNKLGLAMAMARLGQWELEVTTGFFTLDDNLYKLLRTTASRQGGWRMPAAEYVRKFIAPEDAELVTGEIAKATATSDPNFTRQLEHGFIRADGSRGAMLMHFAIVQDAAGRTTKIYGVKQDITDQKEIEQHRNKLEEQLRQAQKMEALGTLAGGIAHDFNNILTGIIGNLQLVEMDLPRNHPAQNALQNAGKAGRRARDLVARILAFGRRGPSDRVLTPLGPVVLEALQLLRASIPTSIEIRTAIAEDCQPVLCDVAQIHQVIMNLGTNAAYAMRERGGVLSVALQPVSPGPALRENHPQVRADHTTCLSLHDTGAGMDAAVLHRVFEPFFTTKRPGEGTGLGLTMVYGIMQNHSGAIVVESTVGEGTTIHLYFPANSSPVPETSTPSSEPPFPISSPFGLGRRIVLVDDDDDVLKVGHGLLQRLGFLPEAFASPVSALDAFRAAPADFAGVITDLTMPGMSGLELARQMGLIRPGVPLVLASGYLHGDAQEEMHRLGLRHFVRKPFTLHELARHLRTVLGEPGG